ncbi:MAG: tetratricopeptide repeat protein [Lentisphaerae bacterium]|nr:tetratricopeptide repeat protein [Lentisphaerota bacterium]
MSTLINAVRTIRRVPACGAIVALAAMIWLVAGAGAQDMDRIRDAPAVGTPAAFRFRDADSIRLEADKARDAGETSKAIQLYRAAAEDYSRLLRDYPAWEPAVTRFRAASCENEAKRLSEEMSVPKPPSSPSARPPADVRADSDGLMRELCAAASLMLRSGQLSEARALLSRGLRTDPDNVSARVLMGIVHCRERGYDNAIFLLRPVVDEDGANVKARMALAAAYYAVGRVLSAESELRRVLETDERVPEAHYNMAQVLLAMEPPDLALAGRHYRRALALGAAADKSIEARLAGAGNAAKPAL